MPIISYKKQDGQSIYRKYDADMNGDHKVDDKDSESLCKAIETAKAEGLTAESSIKDLPADTQISEDGKTLKDSAGKTVEVTDANKGPLAECKSNQTPETPNTVQLAGFIGWGQAAPNSPAPAMNGIDGGFKFSYLRDLIGPLHLMSTLLFSSGSRTGQSDPLTVSNRTDTNLLWTAGLALRSEDASWGRLTAFVQGGLIMQQISSGIPDNALGAKDGEVAPDLQTTGVPSNEYVPGGAGLFGGMYELPCFSSLCAFVGAAFQVHHIPDRVIYTSDRQPKPTITPQHVAEDGNGVKVFAGLQKNF